MKRYGHLTSEERSKIEILLKLKFSHRNIAKLLCRSQSTISDEINRNTKGKEQYIASRAQERSIKRGYWQRRQAPLKDSWTWRYVLKKLKKRWSPEIISGRLKRDHGKRIHHETIYRYIYSEDGIRNQLYQYLTLHRKRRMKNHGRKVKSAPIAGRTMISQRPEVEGFGHWETDNMEGTRSDKNVISVTIEKRTRFMTADLISKGSQSKTNHIVRRLSSLPVTTITTDNGSENAMHMGWAERLSTSVYFCNPYHSWEKGLVENSIGRLRKYIPKRQTISDLTGRKLGWIVGWYNSTPRKCLNYLTPKEAFMAELRNLK
jgi:IS30 family transposase